MPAEETNNNSVSVIIVNHRSNTVLKTCVESLYTSADLIREVIIVDNPVSRAEKLFSHNDSLNIIIVPTERRLGFGAAVNLGSEKAEGRFLLLLNPDITMKADTIAKLVDQMHNSVQAGIVAAKLVDTQGEFAASCRRFPTLTNLIASRQSMFMSTVATTYRYTLPDYDVPTRVDAAAAACMLIRHDLFRELGGFDTRFFMYVEDTDLCYRAFEKGFQTLYVPDAEATHIGGYSTRRYRYRRLVWHHVSMWKYLWKHEGLLGTVVIATPALLLNCALSLLMKRLTLHK